MAVVESSLQMYNASGNRKGTTIIKTQKYTKIDIHHIFQSIILALYLFTVMWYTTLKRACIFKIPEFELLWSYKKWFAGDAVIGKQILLNIAMFIPYGFLLSSLLSSSSIKSIHHTRKNHIFIICITAFVFSSIIECSQLFLLRGLFECDDIINNVLGAVLGYGLHQICSRFLPGVLGFRIISIGCIAIGIVCVCILCASGHTEQGEPISKSVCFQIDEVSLDAGTLELRGVAFDYEMAIEYYAIVLQSTATNEKIYLNTDYGNTRQDVDRYFECETEYTNTGFAASGNVNTAEEYEIFLQTPWKTLVPMDVYITGKNIYYVPAANFNKPDIIGMDIENIVNNGYLRVYRPDFNCWVYQYDGSLYWIVDQNFYFEEDGSTYIQYQLHTTQIENLPVHRLENEWFWDNIGGDFEKYEIHGDFGKYRVMKRDLPTEYSITSIVTGYYTEGSWVWQEYFRPVYEW